MKNICLNLSFVFKRIYVLLFRKSQGEEFNFSFSQISQKLNLKSEFIIQGVFNKSVFFQRGIRGHENIKQPMV